MLVNSTETRDRLLKSNPPCFTSNLSSRSFFPLLDSADVHSCYCLLSWYRPGAPERIPVPLPGGNSLLDGWMVVWVLQMVCVCVSVFGEGVLTLPLVEGSSTFWIHKTETARLVMTSLELIGPKSSTT